MVVMTPSSESEVVILEIKGRHYVSMDNFEHVVRDVLAPDAGLQVRIDRYPQFDMAVCEAGMFQIIGCGPRYVPEPEPARMLVTVRGLVHLLPTLLRNGAECLSGPTADPRGVLVKLRLPGGEVTECLEPLEHPA